MTVLERRPEEVEDIPADFTSLHAGNYSSSYLCIIRISVENEPLTPASARQVHVNIAASLPSITVTVMHTSAH